jgi:hypothetical protein
VRRSGFLFTMDDYLLASDCTQFQTKRAAVSSIGHPSRLLPASLQQTSLKQSRVIRGNHG